jgi:S1-C subfamily serine protease
LPFAGFEPSAGSAPPPASADVAAAQKAASAASVKVTVAGCGRGVTGSGVVVAPDLVLTNAHVVAGGRNTSVRAGNGDHSATPVYFDPDMDIAVLRVTRLDVNPLLIAESNARNGSGAAVLGYPGGGALTVTPATVLTRQRAVGRDIWGGDLVTRDVYVLQADVRPGDSGGPFVDTSGTVLGLVFARSVVHDGVGYALEPDALRNAVDHAGTAKVGTGSCVP